MAQGRQLVEERQSEVSRLQAALEEIALTMGKRFKVDPDRAQVFASRRSDELYGALEAERKRA